MRHVLAGVLLALFGAAAADEAQCGPLLAHWTFDGGQAQLLADKSGSTNTEAAGGERPSSKRGVYGDALALRGQHQLRVTGFGRPELEAVSLCAWVLPATLDGFREIFRQENEHRVLFSFQGGGSILSLGLDIGGYLECDAPVDPALLLDGNWHHCAATFDGAFMRVYLDGRLVQELERPGVVAIDPSVAAYIGSSGGANEHFEGRLDDLRIYASALPGDRVAALFAEGSKEVAAFLQEMDAAASETLVSGASFAETLALTRKQIAERAEPVDSEVGNAVLRLMRARFPRECAEYAVYTGASPLEYLLAGRGRFEVRQAQQLMDLLLEYKPLTEYQIGKQTPEDARRWGEAERIRAQFEGLKARGPAARFSPEWPDLILEAGRRIQFRPRMHEAVAPYVKPETPETRDLDAAQARAVLESDWMHQANQNPDPDRIRAEIAWTRALTERIEGQFPGMRDFSAERLELNGLEGQATGLSQPDKVLYFRVREVKRRVMFLNPAVDFDRVVFVDMPYPQGSEWQHETRHRLGYMAVPGARILALDGLRPDGRVSRIMPQPPLHGSFWRFDVSHDAQRLLICFKPHNEKSFHLYEVGVDGSGCTQLTDGPYDDLDPIYLPDERHVLFSTTRGHTYVRCMPPTNAFVLARAERDGRNIYLISSNNEPDYLPSVMNDGRILYTRWEYTDKPLWRAQKLWTINPDGTQVSTLWGNQSVWPDLMKDARSIPGSTRVLFTGSAHHNWFSGSVGILDPAQGFNFPLGLTKVTADVPWPECGNGPVDPVESPAYHASGEYPAYYSPYPLSERDFLVSAQRDGRFRLYLMDTDGNRELIYEGVNNIFHAMPLRPRSRPPVLADRVMWPNAEDRERPRDGVIYTGNVYHGAPPELQGRARYLRILNIEPKTYTYWYQRPYISTGPVVSAVQSEGVKRMLGTVRIEDDGSVAFKAPAGMALHFQLLDENQRALQTMRSFVNVMPGERRGCLGCHESHSRTPVVAGQAIAFSREPQDIAPPPWSDDTVSYPRYVQPVLDRYCGKCHQGDGGARKTLDLTERPSAPVFTEPYLTLIGRPTWGAPYAAPETPPPGWGIANTLMVEAYGTTDPAAYVTPPPMTCLSYNSRLIEMASSGKHHEVRVDPVSLLRLIVWVDTMCPYRGAEEIRAIDDPEFQGVEWLAIRPKIKHAPRIRRPGPVD
ncbi:MAG: hypothetical protein KA184_17870 [Candidatus Hydrogenedentes bacterium]|nr:hypothetical protein [Candidatus Hydrogenedentota bacterium]